MCVIRGTTNRNRCKHGSCFRSHLGEASVIMGHHSGVGAVQLLDDLKALVELSEDVYHRAGEQSVLRRLLELQVEGGRRQIAKC